jgi:hypothetical protein
MRRMACWCQQDASIAWIGLKALLSHVRDGKIAILAKRPLAAPLLIASFRSPGGFSNAGVADPLRIRVASEQNSCYGRS